MFYALFRSPATYGVIGIGWVLSLHKVRGGLDVGWFGNLDRYRVTGEG